MKHRILRVRELLKRELSEVLRKDFVFDNALVTVNDVDVTRDLKNAHVYLGIIAKEDDAAERIIDDLNRKHGRIQNKIFSRVVLKFTPRFHFKRDDSIERGVRIVAAIDELEIPADELGDGGEHDAVDGGGPRGEAGGLDGGGADDG